MHITRLRLLGFKSFVESAELHVERGLTGVVGPNGCGKSNLLEALRWVMGETSYKSMRASSMEDVIFSGTNARPSRNIAEVSMVLDNRDRKAHPAFNNDDNLEITRRIERDSGSEYRINGKPVRARDVQLLFADASTGARSPALVQQGRIGEIVSAKPRDRRFILEEAAGITGLHSRRHEAEIKLRGAENNLERLQDILGQMESRHEGLKRQARQVKRYRAIQRDLEALQILQHYLNWLSFEQAVNEAEQAHQTILADLGEKTKAESEIRQLQIKSSEVLPKLREREMVTAAIVQRLNIEAEHLVKEQQALTQRKQELEVRCRQTEADLTREKQRAEDESERQDQMSKELAALQTQIDKDAACDTDPHEELREARQQLETTEQQLLSRNRELAEAKARHTSLIREHNNLSNTAKQLGERQDNQRAEEKQLKQELAEIADFEVLKKQITSQSEIIADLDQKLQINEQELEQARLNESDSLTKHAEARGRFKAMSAEIKALEKSLQTPSTDDDHPVLEQINVTPGYETALGAALGDDLEASLNENSALHWSTLNTHADPSPLKPLPDNTIPLAQLVTAPAPLLRRLEMIGIVERGEGDELQAGLVPGQRLVSVEGDLWRWDGFVARADAPSAAARRLSERNRLEQLQSNHQIEQSVSTKAEEAHLKAQDVCRQIETARKALKQQRLDHHEQAEKQRSTLARAEHKATSHKARLAAINDHLHMHKQQLQEFEARNQELAGLLADTGSFEALEKQVEQLTDKIAKIRPEYHDRKAAFDQLEREKRTRKERHAQLDREAKHMQRRFAQGQDHIKALAQRLKQEEQELLSLTDLPEQGKTKRDLLNTELEKAIQKRRQAGDELADAENTLREIERGLHEAQSQSLEMREERAKYGARLEAARNRLGEQHQLIRAELECSPEDCLQKAGMSPEDKLPGRDDLERRISRFTKDRERLGNVNLRADQEAEELAGQIEEMGLEHQDLTDAISTLQAAISGLNREGRRRLMSAFKEINEHFEALFTTLFGGGKARLELIESDDPLQAGLEIIASPPGKKPQVLTLLSGGEKALTALSLIFAVFLTNPAPICVLDEVDAPLDDANVERFCALLDEMTKKTDTRFLVITHHPTTMSHMDRLFGVTMAEKGVSQLVSVDLSTAESYRDQATVNG